MCLLCICLQLYTVYMYMHIDFGRDLEKIT